MPMRWALFYIAAIAVPCGQAQTRIAPDQIRGSTPPPATGITLRSITTSSTQAVIAYTAPGAEPCHIVVSEGAAVGAPVIDLDPALFAGADSDSRAGSISNGMERTFVSGLRQVAKAQDGRYYSRALQAFTDHAFRITCGQAHLDGSFRTANVPSGVTFADAFQVDPARPGKWMMPTQVQDRKQTIVDPQTGVLLKRLSLDAEKGGNGAGMLLSYGGMVRNCGIERITAPDGSSGYICTIFDVQAMGAVYWIIPATGETRFLGRISKGYPYVSGQKTMFWTDSSTGNVFKTSYIGNFLDKPAGTWAELSPDVFYSGPVNALIHAFDPSFDPTLFGCGGTGADAKKYALIICTRSVQDSYGWVAALYGGDGRPLAAACGAGEDCPRIVGALNVMNAAPCRWCGLHNEQLTPGYPLISINYQRLVDWSHQLGTAPWIITLAASITPTDTVLTFTRQPQPQNSDPYRQKLKPGDLIAFGGAPDEVVRVLAVVENPNGTLTVTVTRDYWQNGAKAWSANYGAWMMCSGWGGMGYWKFLQDAHGADTTNTKTLTDFYWGYGGHMDAGPLGRVEEGGDGWQAVVGDIMAKLNTPISLTVVSTVKFAGTVAGFTYGNTTSRHPSYHQDAAQTTPAQQKWFLDNTPFDGSNVIADSSKIHKISGQLYSYAVAPGYGGELRRKYLPTAASTGGESLRDISGPGSQISDDAASAYTYCVVDVKAGECRAGSALGDIFVNAPNIQTLNCSGGDGPNPGNKDLCLENANPYYQAVTQVYLSDVSGDDSIQKSRVLTRALSGLKGGLYYSLAKSLPDSSWMILTAIDPDTGVNNGWIAKVPPLDTAGDGIDRRTFIPKIISLPKPTGARITGAAIEFGYAEDGAVDQFRCTTRAEACIATHAAVDAANPFAWDSEHPAPASCADGCTIAIPLVPLRVGYWRARYYDAAGTLVTTGPPGVVIDGTVVPLSRRRTL